MKKTKQFAGRTLRFVKIKKQGGQFYIYCNDEEGGGFILGLNSANSPMFKSEKEAQDYWNADQDGSDKWNGEVVWGMEA